MNVQDYRAAGYALGIQMEQSAVTRAEKDVIAAYIVPLTGKTPTQEEVESEPLKTAVMSLAFLLLSQRSIAATRAGAKTKNSPSSSSPTAEDVLRQHAPSCVFALKQIAGKKQASKYVSDICGIYFRTNYFHM